MTNFETYDLRDASLDAFDYGIVEPVVERQEVADETAVAEAQLTLRAIGERVRAHLSYN
jgi:hypothetical protein